ncbi:hypothetical protein GCM10010441_29870 [Kitasatospora paracochleata]|uniref:TrbL/VirB6 plasmid conjugal transfer protein n=1 Tax=Kitasatospora paracochleata TaxID=58354 RepID=A0ABT1JB98_9ACTN|nr:hypothetical protein [Kitasatospora paracochleata]MCP2313946.1 hypothetical protein [Kitasatospora paracochleata]
MNTPTFPAALERAARRAGVAGRRALRIARTVHRFAAAYWPGRRTVLMTAGMTFLFLLAGASAADAADGSERGGILAPLNVLSSEGVPLDNYDLKSENGGTTDIRSHVCNLLLGAGFALVRMAVGLMCWVCQWIWNFPIVSTLVETAQKLSSEFFQVTANDLSLYPLFLAAGTAFGCILIMRGRIGRGAGEMVITLLLSTLVLMPALTPRSVLGEQGPLVQTQQAAHEVGQLAAGVNGPDPGCTSDKDKKDPSCPMRMTLTRVLVVQPYQLLQYGIIPNPQSENAHERELAEVHRRWIHGEIKGKDAGDGCVTWVPGSEQLCPKSTAWEELKKELQKHGDEGKAAYNFSVNSNWDRVGGTVLVLFATLLIAIVVLGMALVHLGTQFADVVAASLTAPALVWAMLPGGNRSALWKWLGIFMTSVVTEFAISIMLPLFALGADQILTNSKDTVMIQRLLILDGFALVLLVFHRRIFAAAGQVGERFASRMRYAKVGGSLFLGENQGLALAMSQAMGTLSPSGGGLLGGGRAGGGALGGGLFGGGSPAHGALMRKARIAEGLAAIADPGLGRMNGGAMVLGAYGDVRRGLSALALPFHAAHQLVAGNPLPPHKLAARMKPVGSRGPLGGQTPQHGPGGPGTHGGPGGGRGPAGGGGRPPFGRQQQMPAHGLTPVGHALHNSLLGTRAGRLAIRAGQVGKLGFNAVVGAPATWTRLNRANDAMWENVNRQWEHYSNVRREWTGDWAEGAKDLTKDIPAGYRMAKRGAEGTVNAIGGTARHQYYQAAAFGQTYGPTLVNGVRAAYEAAHIGYDLTLGDPFQQASGRAGHFAPADQGEVWEHAKGRGPEYPFHEVQPSEPVIEADRAGQVVVYGGEGDNGPSEVRSALGPGVFPPTEPIRVIEGEEPMVINERTGEILASRPFTSIPPAPAMEGMDPAVLRRVSPEVLREPGSTPLEALRMRRHIGYQTPQDTAGSNDGPGDGLVDGPDGGLGL